jgi:GTPase SAR1 family protein
MVMFNVLLQVLLGDVGAGKSSLVLRFVKGQFVEFQVGGYEDFWIYYIFDFRFASLLLVF